MLQLKTIILEDCDLITDEDYHIIIVEDGDLRS
jgi:hypothetical protein